MNEFFVISVRQNVEIQPKVKYYKSFKVINKFNYSGIPLTFI